jgi:hypothetical protein
MIMKVLACHGAPRTYMIMKGGTLREISPVVADCSSTAAAVADLA